MPTSHRLQQTRDHPIPRSQPSYMAPWEWYFHNRTTTTMVKQPTSGIRPYRHHARNKRHQVRKGRVQNGKKMISLTKQLEKDLPQTTISTLDLPPLKNKDNNKEINLYNYILARERKTTEISMRLREEDVHEIIRGDGIHLTPRGGK